MKVYSTAIGTVSRTPRGVRVQFQHGGSYLYLGVTRSEFRKFVASPSIGRHYNRHIKGQFPVVKLNG